MVMDVPTEEEVKEKPTISQVKERCKIDIGNDVYVIANVFNDSELIHIRQFERYGSKTYPTTKGVALPLSRWLMLEGYANFIEESIDTNEMQRERQQRHLGGGVMLTVGESYIAMDIRQYWKPKDSDEPCPTKRGVQLSYEQAKKLLDVMKVIRDFVPDLDDTVPCYMNEDHQNQEGMLWCRECNPFQIADNLH